MTVDTQRGIAYIPLGSPTYDFYGVDRIGANLFGTSIVALDARTGKRLWHFQFVHHDLWDLDPSAAPQLTTIRHNGRNRDVVVVTSKTGWLYVLDRVTGEPIWPIEERPFPKCEMPGEQSWPTQPHPTKPRAVHAGTPSPWTTSARTCRPRKRRRSRSACWPPTNKGVFTPISSHDTVHVPTSNGGTLFGGTAAEPRTGAVYIVAHDNPGILRLVHPGERPRAAAPPQMPPGQVVYQQNCQTCHGADRDGYRERPCRSFRRRRIPANNIVAGASRFDAATRSAPSSRPARAGCRRSRTSPATDVDNLVSYLTTAAGRARAVGRPGGGAWRGAGWLGRTARADRRIGIGVEEARTRRAGRGRGALPPIPKACPSTTRPTINEYNTVGNRIKPPFTSIVKYDLNKPGIQWRIPYGDDPALAARGITGTGTPARPTASS